MSYKIMSHYDVLHDMKLLQRLTQKYPNERIGYDVMVQRYVKIHEIVKMMKPIAPTRD
jgi:hypothetical protein